MTAELPALATADELNQLYLLANQQIFRSSGAGTYLSLYQTMLSQFNRFGINAMPPNHEQTGYTFITRPKLNLSVTSLRQDRILSVLDTPDYNSLQFATRCYLDTFLTNRHTSFAPLAKKSPFFNWESPFIIPLSNNLMYQSGWPDPVLEPETSDAGFFSEDFTMIKGSDRLNRTYEVTLTFRDMLGGFIISLLYMWHRYIELVVRGDTTAYPEDIAARRVNYTCSIYRFVLDQSRQVITKWAKGTGCIPRSPPIGNMFNYGEGENYIRSAERFSIPFIVNKVEYMDPIIFRDFNTLVKRFSPTARTWAEGNPGNTIVLAGMEPSHNFVGIPYIDTIGGQNRLDFLCSAADLADPYAAQLAALNQQFTI